MRRGAGEEEGVAEGQRKDSLLHTCTQTHTHNSYATPPLKSRDNDLQISPKRILRPAASSCFTPPSLLVSPTCLSLIAPVFHHSLHSVAETYQRLNQ